jgi:hypothetical protein
LRGAVAADNGGDCGRLLAVNAKGEDAAIKDGARQMLLVGGIYLEAETVLFTRAIKMVVDVTFGVGDH